MEQRATEIRAVHTAMAMRSKGIRELNGRRFRPEEENVMTHIRRLPCFDLDCNPKITTNQQVSPLHRSAGFALAVFLLLSAPSLLAAIDPAQWPPTNLSSLTDADWSAAFQQMRSAQNGFRVESLADFKEMTAQYVAITNDGTVVNAFHLTRGELVQCVTIASQRSYIAAGNTNLPPLPLSDDHTPLSSAAQPNTALFGLDGTLDDNGNIRRCEEGSVPHLIPSLESIYRFKTLRDFQAKDPSPLAQPGAGDGHEWARADRSVNNWGSSAMFNIWSPYVEPAEEFSLSQLWVLGVNGAALQSAETGWQKYPRLYGDNSPHLFIFFTTNNYTSFGDGIGCYNLLCAGFVQTNSSVIIGGTLPASILGGQQNAYQIAFIRNSSPPLAWWLQFNGTYVGYYPATLYNAQGLATTSNVISFGGEIVNVAQGGFHTTTQMGSGKFPTAGLNNAAYTRSLLYIDTNSTAHDATGLSPVVTAPSYYGLSLNPTSQPNWGQWFLFGGPGRTTSPISFANATTSTSTVTQGQTFTIDYSIVGTDQPVTVMLGASLGNYSTSSWPYSDPPHDISVTVPGLSSSLRSRQFTVSASTPSGTYDLAVALWRDRNGNGLIDAADEVLGQRYLLGQIVVLPLSYALSVTGGGTGQGTVTGNGINCTISAGSTSGTCTASYPSGTAVSLFATPSGGSTFGGWGGACSGSGGCSIAMNAAKSASASFGTSVTNYTLSVTGGGTGQGTVTGTGINCTISSGSASGTCTASFASGAVVSLTATPTGGSTFSGWGGACSGPGGCSITMNAAMNASASFVAPLTNQTLSVNGAGAGQGTVTGTGINCTTSSGSTSGTCSAAYTSGTVVSLTATPTGGSTFGGWAGEGCSGMGGCQVTMSQARSVTATFNNGGGSGTPHTFIDVTGATAQGHDLGVGPDGSVYVLYPTGSPATLAVVKSTDGGLTWSSAIAVPNSAFSNFEYHLVVDSSGTIHVVWWLSSASGTEVLYSRSNNGGASFSAPIRVRSGNSYNGYRTNNASEPVVAADGTGNVYVAYGAYTIDGGGSFAGYNIWVSRSTDGGASFQPEFSINAISGAQRMPVRIRATPANFYVLYIDQTNNDLYFYRRNAGGAPGNTGRLNANAGSVLYDGDFVGAPNEMTFYATYSDTTGDSEGNITFCRSTDGGITWPTCTRVNDNVNRQQNSPRVGLDSLGGLHVVWADGRASGRLQIYYAYSFTDGASFGPNGNLSAPVSQVDFSQTHLLVDNANSAVYVSATRNYSQVVVARLPTTQPQQAPSTPAGVVAAAVSTTRVNVAWSAVPEATSYEVDRRAAGGGFTLIGIAVTNSFADSAASADAAYLYRVRAVNSSGSSPSSGVSLATAVIFDDNPLMAGMSVVKSVHLAQLRTAVSAVRLLAGLPAANFTDPAAGGTLIKAVHITELRSALDAGLGALGLPTSAYSDTSLSGVSIKAAHFQELRNRVNGAH